MSAADVIIIGGGMAGLTAARQLRDRHVIVLEQEHFVGGRTHSLPAGNGGWFCLGAQYLPPETANLARELGVPVLYGEMPPPALIFHGKRVIERNPVLWFLKVPFSLGGRVSFLKLLFKLSRTANRYDRMSAADKAHLQELPLAKWLGTMHPDMHELLEMWATFAGGKTIEGVSTYSGIAVVHAALGRPGSHYGGSSFTTAVGGPGKIAERIAAELPKGSLLTGAAATRMEQDADGVKVSYTHTGHRRSVSASLAIVTVPSVQIPSMVAGLPDKLVSACNAVEWSRSITMGVLVDDVPSAPWNRMYWMRVGGPWISNILNPAYFESGPRRKGSALTLLCSGEPADRLWDYSDKEVTSRVLSQLGHVFPELRGRILDIILQRWPYAYPATGPGTVTAQQILSKPFGRIFFAGDYLIRIGTQEAIEVATRVAEAVRDKLDEKRGR